MLLITKRRQIGALFRHNVYAVSKKLNLSKELKAGGAGNGFIDRSKVRILLCDNDTKSCEEVFSLLLKCSYQVTTVKSARQVIDALNAEGPDIDIILTEVDLPMTKGMKLLKYIMRNNELRRIPDIMMSAQDEVSIVVKCLRLGAADYLVKPLRTNELLNLWTHMWRRRCETCQFIPIFDMDDEDDSVAKMKAAEEALEAKQKIFMQNYPMILLYLYCMVAPYYVFSGVFARSVAKGLFFSGACGKSAAKGFSGVCGKSAAKGHGL
ncbi:hypothetical protein V6Z12_D11G327600 [Gossypium hirsutum]